MSNLDLPDNQSQASGRSSALSRMAAMLGTEMQRDKTPSPERVEEVKEEAPVEEKPKTQKFTLKAPPKKQLPVPQREPTPTKLLSAVQSVETLDSGEKSPPKEGGPEEQPGNDLEPLDEAKVAQNDEHALATFTDGNFVKQPIPTLDETALKPAEAALIGKPIEAGDVLDTKAVTEPPSPHTPNVLSQSPLQGGETTNPVKEPSEQSFLEKMQAQIQQNSSASQLPGLPLPGQQLATGIPGGLPGFAGAAAGGAPGIAGVGGAPQMMMVNGQMVQVMAPPGGVPSSMGNAPSHPDLRMIPVDSLMKPLSNQPEEKHVLSRDAKVLREELVGYVDAILERQDRADVLKKVETFEIETACRRTLRDLTDHFLELDKDGKKKIGAVKSQTDHSKKKIETQDLMIKKLQGAVQEIASMQKRLQQVEQKAETTHITTTKRFDNMKEQITQTKGFLEGKIDAINQFDDKLKVARQEVARLQELFIKTKQELFINLNQSKSDTSKQQAKIDLTESRLEQTVADTKYWLEKYTEAHKQNDKNIEGFRTEMHGRLEAFQYQLDKRVTEHDMRGNMQTLSDMLFIKFQQIEDTKTGLRDLLTYQKYFYPMHMQVLISENMMSMTAAREDQEYMQFQQKRYDELVKKVEDEKARVRDLQDEDLNRHMLELDKYHLKVNDWQLEPLDNVEHDFVSDLIQKYVWDLRKRQNIGNPDEGTFAQVVRKGVKIDECHDLLNELYQKTAGLKDFVAKKEQELEDQRKHRVHEIKVNRMVTKKLDFDKPKVFKRQNSYVPILDDFGDLDDVDCMKREIGKTRVSFQDNRMIANARVQDVTQVRMEANNPLASETQDSVGQSMNESQYGAMMQPSNNVIGMVTGGNTLQQPQGLPFVPAMGGASPVASPRGAMPINSPGAQSGVTANQRGGTKQSGGSGGTQLDSQAKRKLISEIKQELKPLITQVADFSIEKAVSVLKTQIRSLEATVSSEDDKLNKKIDRQIKSTHKLIESTMKGLNEKFDEDLRVFQRQRARDKSDNEMAHNKHLGRLASLEDGFVSHGMHFETLAVVTSMLIENINMQMEAEMADLIDRRAMSLFGVNHKHVDKMDFMQTSKKMKVAKQGHLANKSPSPERANAEDDMERVDNLLGKVAPKHPTLEMDANQISELESVGSQQAPSIPAKPAQIPEPQVESKKMVDNQSLIMKEYMRAAKLIEDTGKLPISIDHSCLMCMQPGRDTSVVLKLFKTACLSYAPSDVKYRDLTMQRSVLIAMRREMVEKITNLLPQSGLFKEGAIYPRRYFDDLILEQQLAVQQSRREVAEHVGGHPDIDNRDVNMQNLLSQKLPFGMAGEKKSYFQAHESLTKAPTAGQLLAQQPGSVLCKCGDQSPHVHPQRLFNPHHASSPKLSQEETNHDSSILFGVPDQGSMAYQKRKVSKFNSRPSNDTNFDGPIKGNLTLDTDSSMSKLKLRQKMAQEANSTRHLRNRTIDIGKSQSGAIEMGGSVTARNRLQLRQIELDDLQPSVSGLGKSKYNMLANRSARKVPGLTKLSLGREAYEPQGLFNERSHASLVSELPKI